MDPPIKDPPHINMRILRLVQDIRVIAVVEEPSGAEKQIIVDSLQRPLPIPYNETL